MHPTQARLEQVRQWVTASLGETVDYPATWGSKELMRFLLILTYDGCVELFLRFNGKSLNLRQLELAIKAIVPGVRMGWGDDTVSFFLPGSRSRPKLMLVDSPMLVTHAGPASEVDNQLFVRTLATIWLAGIDTTNPFQRCAFSVLPATRCPPVRSRGARTTRPCTPPTGPTTSSSVRGRAGSAT